MCIDDNIPADNYCGIILKAEQQEDTDIYGNVKWRRIYLWVDIERGFIKAIFPIDIQSQEEKNGKV